MNRAHRADFDRLLPQLADGSFHYGIMADWLEEFDAGLDLWCVAYAHCPEPVEALQARWATWLKEREPERLVAQDGLSRGWSPCRWEAVQDFRVVINTDPAHVPWRIRVQYSLVRKEGLEVVETLARRDRKRRVLSLFPEVVIGIRYVRHSLPEGSIHPDCQHALELLHAQAEAQLQKDWPHVAIRHTDQDGFRVWKQVIHAPDLIPPEPTKLHDPQMVIAKYLLRDTAPERPG